MRNSEDSEVTLHSGMEVTLFGLVFHNYHWKLALVMNLDLCSGLSDKLVLSLHGERRLECRKVVQVFLWTNDLIVDEHAIMQSIYICLVFLGYLGWPRWTSLDLAYYNTPSNYIAIFNITKYKFMATLVEPKPKNLAPQLQCIAKSGCAQ